jgi:hypothetical protein
MAEDHGIVIPSAPNARNEAPRSVRYPDSHDFAIGITALITSVFGHSSLGIPTGMQDSEKLPDDVPVADAVEQQRAPVEPALDEEASAEPPGDTPLEAPAADWQEQRETVELDPEFDELD